VVLYRSNELGRFLHEALRASPLDEAALFTVWRANPDTLDHSAALAADDDLRAFATELDERFVFVDLRSPASGDGFAWGRYGPGNEVRRHGYERLFAYAPTERKRRLFGRR